MMTLNERKAVVSLSLLYALRMLGLFMVLPVMMLYGSHLEGATPQLLGIAIGGYGLTQAFLQIPFGFLSDRYGRKPILIIGLLIFAFGSWLAADASSVYQLIAGRILQGAGAIASTLMALLTDLTREEQRTKAMAAIGMSIGLAFSLALVLGPIIAEYMGLSGIFVLTALVATIGIAVVVWIVPSPQQQVFHRDTRPVKSQIFSVLGNRELLRLDFGIFALHFVIVATFLTVPVLLSSEGGLDRANHWWLYLPVLLLSFVAMIPLILVAEKQQKMKPVLLFAIFLLVLCFLGLALISHSLMSLIVLMFVFFWAFNILEASLPSLISKMAPAGGKGTAMGVYSSSQFFGAFAGGSIGGWIFTQFDVQGVFLGCACLMGAWLLISALMTPPRHLKSLMIQIGSMDKDQSSALHDRLLKVSGIEEVKVILDEKAAYLKVDHRRLDSQDLELAKQEYQVA